MLDTVAQLREDVGGERGGNECDEEEETAKNSADGEVTLRLYVIVTSTTSESMRDGIWTGQIF